MDDSDDVRLILPLDVLTRQTDDRGRITLGSEYENERVTVAIVEVHDDGE